MKRSILPTALAATLVLALGVLHANHHPAPAPRLAVALPAAGGGSDLRADAYERAAQRASRSRPSASPAPAPRPRPAAPRPPLGRVLPSAGCGSDWQASLGTDERWIYSRESGLDPTPADINPKSGARGLGQLLDSTYADLHLVPDWNPCHEIEAARAYMRSRYGSWATARAFWESNAWW